MPGKAVPPGKAGLADALFATGQKKILGLLFGHPDQTFYTREIIREVSSGTGAVHRELRRMADAGLVSVTKVGNQRHYQANRASPIFADLRGIVAKTMGIAEPLQEALAPCSDKIKNAFVYGSVAAGTDKADSDIDLMVIGDGLTHSDLFAALHKTEAALRRPINPTFYSEADWYRRLREKNAFVTKVNKAPKIFVIGSEADLSDERVAARYARKGRAP
jgi:predicted nucleotidyltransferase